MEELLSSCADAAEGCQHPSLFVEIMTDDKKSDDDDTPSATAFFTARASREFIGEFKVTPSIHTGYAFTWFGLSSAGYSSRKLLSRGK